MYDIGEQVVIKEDLDGLFGGRRAIVLARDVFEGKDGKMKAHFLVGIMVRPYVYNLERATGVWCKADHLEMDMNAYSGKRKNAYTEVEG